MVDVDYAGQSPTANKILKYSTTVNSGAGGWTLGDDNSGSNNTDTTYSISCADGDNADEEKIRLTAGGDGSGDDDIVLEAGTGLSIARSGDKITLTNTVTDSDTNTTYSQSAVSDSGGVKLRLTDSGSTNDDILLTAGTNISFTSVTADGFTINHTGNAAATVTTDDSAPSSPSDGDLWWKSDEGRLKVYYADANLSLIHI